MIFVRENKIYLGFLLMFLLACERGSEHDNSNRKYYVGTFKLSCKNSKLNSYTKDSILYNNLTLTLNNNDSFSFSKDVPFIRKQTGKWRMSSVDGVIYLAYLMYDTSRYGIIEDQVGLSDIGNGGVSLTFPNKKQDQAYVEYLYFERIR